MRLESIGYGFPLRAGIGVRTLRDMKASRAANTAPGLCMPFQPFQ